jgi:AraC-like DNA-binding protein
MQINDILTDFYFFGFLLGLVLCAALMAGGSGRQFANRWLALLVAVISIFVLRKVPFTSGLILQYPHFMGLYPLAFALGPLLYLYTRALARGETRFNRASGIHFVPLVLVFLSLIPIYALSTEDKHKVATAYFTGEFADEIRMLGYWGYCIVLMSWLHFSCYCLGVILLLRRHEVYILNQFSYIEKVSLQWLRLLARFCLLVALAGVAAHSLAFQLDYPLASPITVYTEMLLVLLIYVVGYMGLRQPAIFQPSPEEPSSPMPASSPKSPLATTATQSNLVAMDTPDDAFTKYEKSSLTDGAAETYKAELLELMARDKPFLDSELTLTKLSELTDIQHHHLSQVINANLGRNFYDFINHYRVETAKELLADPQKPREAITDIAMAAGFNNKNSFYKAFRNQLDMTPAEYRRQALKTGAES